MEIQLLGEKRCDLYQEDNIKNESSKKLFNYYVIQTKDKELDFLMCANTSKTYYIPCALISTKVGDINNDRFINSCLVDEHTKNYEKYSELVTKINDRAIKSVIPLENCYIDALLIDNKYVLDILHSEHGFLIFFYDKSDFCRRVKFYDEDLIEKLNLNEEQEFLLISGVFEDKSTFLHDEKAKGILENLINLMVKEYNQVFSK